MSWLAFHAVRCHLLLVTLTWLISPVASMSTSTVPSSTSSVACLSQCECQANFFSNEKYTHRIQCTGLPDWSGLSRLPGLLSLALGVEHLPSLRRADFPSGFPIVSVYLVGTTSLDPDVFQNLRESLEDVMFNHFTMDFNVPFSFLSNLPKLKRLEIIDFVEKNDGVYLTGSPFKNIEIGNLTELLFSYENITGIGPDVFDGLGAQAVIFSRTEMSEFPGTALRKVSALRSVTVYSNALRRLQEGATDGLSLLSLDIGASGLEEIEAGALTGVKDSLVSLRLNDNLLRDIPYDALAPLRALRELELDGNPISQISRPITGNFCLKRFEIRRGSDDVKLRSVHPEAFKRFGDCLEYLQLDDSTLTDLPTLEGLRKLRLLTIKSPNITRIKSRAFAGSRFRHAMITAPLEDVEPGAFDGMAAYPVTLHLLDTRLPNLEFFYQYGGGTFFSIHVVSSELPCDCRLAGVRLNLRTYKHHDGDRRVSGDLSGGCLKDGEAHRMQGPLVDALFSACTNLTVLEPRVSSAASSLRGEFSPFPVSLVLSLALLAGSRLQLDV